MRKKPKFKIGDEVRISKFKHTFEKVYTLYWTTETFRISQVRDSKPTTYFLKDYQNEPISSSFHEQELCKVKNPNIHLVEKVLKKRGNKLYVKWLGFDNSHNSWIDKWNIACEQFLYLFPKKRCSINTRREKSCFPSMKVPTRQAW